MSFHLSIGACPCNARNFSVRFFLADPRCLRGEKSRFEVEHSSKALSVSLCSHGGSELEGLTRRQFCHHVREVRSVVTAPQLFGGTLQRSSLACERCWDCVDADFRIFSLPDI